MSSSVSLVAKKCFEVPILRRGLHIYAQIENFSWDIASTQIMINNDKTVR